MLVEFYYYFSTFLKCCQSNDRKKAFFTINHLYFRFDSAIFTNFSRGTCFSANGMVYYKSSMRSFPDAIPEIMETYRSGRNELDSKSGCPQGHVGSNPTVSARNTTVIWIELWWYFFKWFFESPCNESFRSDNENGTNHKKVFWLLVK